MTSESASFERDKPLIVAVDDEPDFLSLLRRMLTPRYAVETFTSGQDVLDSLEILMPDLLVLDMHMPGESGAALCRRIRAVRRLAYVPVLFLTASREDADFLDTMKAGGDAYLNKPVGQAQLHVRIREMLSLPAAPPGARRH